MQKSSPIRFAEIEFDTYTFSLSLTAPGFDRVGRYGRFPPVMVFSPPSSLLPLPDSFFAFSHDRGIPPPPVCACSAAPLNDGHPFLKGAVMPQFHSELGLLLFCDTNVNTVGRMACLRRPCGLTYQPYICQQQIIPMTLVRIAVASAGACHPPYKILIIYVSTYNRRLFCQEGPLRLCRFDDVHDLPTKVLQELILVDDDLLVPVV